MQQNTFTCSKCHKNYPLQSKVMHELHCTGVSNVSQPHMPQQQPIYQPQMNVNMTNQTKTSITNNNQKCPKCGLEFPSNEMSDHLLVHQLDEENNIPEDVPQDQDEAALNNNYDDEEMNNNQYGNQMNVNNNNMNYNIQPQSQSQSIQRNVHTSTDPNGYTTETIEEISGNTRTVRTIRRDPNGNIVGQQMSTQSVGGNGSNSISMNFNGMPMQMPMHMNMNLPTGFRFNFGAGPLNLSDVVFNDVHSTFMHNPFFSSMINNQNNLEEFLDNLNQPAQHPVPDEIVNELPEITIDSVEKLDGDKKDCIICLNSFKQGDKALILPCIHIFHTDCIKNWFKTQNTCPICKFQMDANSLNNQNAQ